MVIESRYSSNMKEFFMEAIKKAGKIIPGFVLAIVIAAVAKFLESLLPIH